MGKQTELKVDSTGDVQAVKEQIKQACDLMEQIYTEGFYPKVLVERSWSKHNPVITGEIARPKAYRWYLIRELQKLAKKARLLK